LTKVPRPESAKRVGETPLTLTLASVLRHSASQEH